MKNLPMLTKSFLGISIFLMVPLIISSVVIYNNFVAYSENEISKSSITNLQTVQRLNEQLFEYMTKQTIRLSLDIKLQEISSVSHYSDLTKDPARMTRLMKLMQILDDTVSMDVRIKSIYVYMENADYMITNKQGIILMDQFPDKGFIKEYDKNKDALGMIWLNSRPDTEIIDGTANYNTANGNNNTNVITSILPFRSLMIDYAGAVVVNIKEMEIYNFMNDQKAKTGGYVFIMDNKGNIISHADKSLIAKSYINHPYIRDILNSPESTGYYINNSDTGKELLSFCKSEFNNWIYIGVTPMNSLLYKTNKLVERVILIFIGLMILGNILSYLFSRRMYNPVKKLMLDIQERKGIDFKGAGNEMAVLSKVFDSLARQEDTLSNEIEKNKRQLQNKYIIDLLEGNMDRPSSNDALNQSVVFPYKYFIGIVIAIDKYDLFIEKYAAEQQYYMKMMVLKACEEITAPFFHTYGTLFEKNKIAVVVNYENSDSKVIHDRLSACLAALQSEIGKVMSNTVTIGIGNYCDDIASVSLTFTEAREALESRIFVGSGKVIEYSSLCQCESKYYYPFHIETHLLNYLKLGSKEDVYSSIDELINEIRNHKGISADNVIQIFIQLVGNTAKFLVEVGINIGNIFGSDYNIYQKLASKETLDDIRVWLIGFHSAILQYMSSSMDVDRISSTDKVMNFLQLNYKSNIDTTAIAENTGLAYSSIGRIVRNKTGKNVLEYINGLRVEEAKRLLRQTNMNILDIAQNVGYNNHQSFQRFFKRYEGVTPGEFRSLRNLK